MSALHNISGFDLPIVMDTPLGNLDVDMRHNIAEFLPQFVQGRQIVLLVTGTEYTEDFRETLKGNVGKEYTIRWNNDDNGKESEVI
jgi:DNA sulfur modification protein DndD